MIRKTVFSIAFLLLGCLAAHSQTRILFDASKAETASNADWVIDADLHNLGFNNGPAMLGGSESNPQQYPTPAQSGITTSTSQEYWKGGISAWGVDLAKKGYIVESLPYNGKITYKNSSNLQDLSLYKVFIVCEPNIVFTTAEKTAILQFVQNGGGLFMVSDHTVSDRNNDGWDSPAIWNDLMSNNSIKADPFGITFDLANFSQTTSNVANLPLDTLLHGSMGNVTQVMWSAGTTMTINTSANPTVTGIVYKTGSSTNGSINVMVAHAGFGAGKVVAIGDSSPCDDGTGDPGDQLYDGWIADASGNHQKLIMNATLWLANSNTFTGTNEIPANNDIRLFPNPFSDQAQLSISPDIDINNGKMIITDLNGRILHDYEFGNSHLYVIKKNGLKVGMYMYQVISNGKLSGRGKFIISD
jgi:hypothetical protein